MKDYREFMKTIDKIVDLVGYAADIITSNEDVEEYLIEVMHKADILDAPDLAIIDYIKELFKNNWYCTNIKASKG